MRIDLIGEYGPQIEEHIVLLRTEDMGGSAVLHCVSKCVCISSVRKPGLCSLQ